MVSRHFVESNRLNNFAVSSAQLGEGLQNAGAALMAGGNSFTESLALLTASNNTLQDISKSSTAMRTIAARLRQSSAELEEIGDEGLAAEYNTTSKYRAKLLAITGVDILESDLKTFRSTYDILKDIAGVWDSLEDIDQAAVTEMIGGVRQQSAVASLFQTFGDAKRIIEDTANAAGSMQSAYENYIDSIQGRLNTLTASSQEMFNNLLDSDLIKGGVSAVTALVEALNWFIETIGLLPTVGAGVGLYKLISSVGAFNNEVKGALAVLDGIKETKEAVDVLQAFDLGVSKTALSLSNLSDARQADAMYALKQLAAHKLIHKANIQDIVDSAKLNAVESQRLKGALERAAANNLEKLSVEAVTFAELNDAMIAARVDDVKRQEIAARYANAMAAKSEASSLTGLAATAKTAGAGLVGVGKSILAVAKAHPVLAIAAVAVSAFAIVKKIQKEQLEALEKNAEESREKYSELTSEVESLTDRLTDVRDRIKEIERIGVPEMVDKDELKSLKEQNEELERELRIKKALAEMADQEAEQDALLALGEKYPDWLSSGRSKIDQYNHNKAQQAETERQYAYLLDFKRLGVLPSFMDSQYELDIELAALEGSLDYYKKVLQTQATELKELYEWIDTNVVAAIGGSASTEDAQRFLGEWNEFLTQYDTMLAKSYDGQSGSSGIFAGGEDVVTAEQLNKQLGLVIEKYELLRTLQNEMSAGGGLSADSLEKITEKFSGLDEAVAQYHQGLIDEKELVRLVSAAYQGALNNYRKMEGKLNVQAMLADETEIKTFSEQLSDIVGKFDLLHEAQKSFSESGTLTASTLSSIIGQFPAMEESVMLYVTGMKSGKELLAELAVAYRKDETNWKSTMKAKLYASDAFCNGLSEEQSKLIDELAESYGVDLKNFRTIEEAKADIQRQIIAQLAENYAHYANATLQDLKARLTVLQALQKDRRAINADSLNADDEAGRHTIKNASLLYQDEITALIKAIADIEGAYKGLDDILLEGWNPGKFSSITDDAEDAFEKFKAKWEDWFSDMEFKVNLKYEAGDLDGANKLYQQMVDKAQELLSDAYAEGMTIDDEWVQDLISKVNTYKKALADLRIEEYDKLIEYNDKFDVWNNVDYTKLDKLKEKLAAINEQYITGLRSYQDWYDAFVATSNDIYDIQRDALETVLDEMLAAIKKGYEDEIEMIESVADEKIESLENEKDIYSELIALKKKLLEDTRDEANYEKEVEKRVKSIAKLQERISQLALDNSREATAERLKLEEQLAQEQEELAKFQSDAATDAALEALDAQGEAFEKAQDDKIKEVEDTAEKEVEILKDQLDNEVALRKQALAQIDRDYEVMMQDIVGYFRELGYEIDESLIDKLREGLALVAQFGSYSGADSGISTNVGDLSTSSVTSLVQQMKNNSAAWHNSDDTEKARLAAENERIAELLKAMGYDIWKNAAEGVWYIKIDGKTMRLFEKFHSGGVAGMVGTPKSDEIFALLRKGEVILNDDQQTSLLNIFDNAGKWMQNQMAQTIGAMMKGAYSRPVSNDETRIGTFAPNIEVNITHNGNMSDADAKRYGNQIADVALDKLWSTLQRRGIT